MTASKVTPPEGEDRDIQTALSAKAELELALQAIRSDGRLSDAGKAERIDQAWRQCAEIVAQAQASLRQRYTARAQDLESLLPVGPAVPANASKADAAVLHSAFRNSLAQARQVAQEDPQRLLGQYLEANRFGDDTMRRAVLTAASDAGTHPVLDRWRADNPELADQFAELNNLRDTMSGMSVQALRLGQIFTPPAQPRELTTLHPNRLTPQGDRGGL